MAEIKANGDAIISCGDNFLSLCNQYEAAVNKMFDSLEKINQTAWSGDAANKYVSKVSQDRSTYENFGDYLKMYGQVIKNIGVNVNTIVSKWENK